MRAARTVIGRAGVARQVGFLLLISLLIPACSSPHATNDTAVVLDEYTIAVAPATFREGADLTIRNEGEFGHTLVVSDASGRVITATDVIAPGESVALDADWSSGEYRFTCRIVIAADEGNIIDHYAEGMLADVTVSD